MPSIAPNTPQTPNTTSHSSTSPSSTTTKAQPTTQPTNQLTFSPTIASLISPQAYLTSHLQNTPSTRPSGRSHTQPRPIAITTSSLTNCLGSSVVRQGSTSVVCGVTPEILYAREVADPPPVRPRRRKSRADEASNGAAARKSRAERRRRKWDTDDLAHLHLLVPNIDLQTGSSSSASNAPGQAPGVFAQSLSQRLYRLLLGTGLVDIEDLVVRRPRRDLEGEVGGQMPTSDPLAAGTGVTPGMDRAGGERDGEDGEDEEDEEDNEEKDEVVGWCTLHINLTVLALDGQASLIDAAWAAMLAALRDLRLPRAYWDDEREMVICSEVADGARALMLSGSPVVCSWGVFEEASQGQEGKYWVLNDMDAFEEGVCRESGSLVVDCTHDKTRLLRVEKRGGGRVGMEEMKSLVGMAERRWQDVMAAMPPARKG